MVAIQHCPICGSDKHDLALTAIDETVTKESFSIQACDTCGFHFTSPRPEEGSLGKYYQSGEYISHSAQARTFRDRVYRALRRLTVKGKHRLLARTHPSGHVLDVGCGTGDFLFHLQQKGYQCQGIELSRAARSLSKEKGLRVHEKLSDLASVPTFDIITLWHVLEHLADPMATLVQLKGMLKPNGLLVIAVPDRESWDAKHYGSKWAAWDVPRHLSHFRRHDILSALKRAGFTNIRVRGMWLDAAYVSMLSEQYKGAGPIGSFLKGVGFGIWSNAVAFTSKRPTSSSLYIANIS